MMLILAVIAFIVGRSSRKEVSENIMTKISFALMGVAFLLLETKSVVQFSLLFGTTWYNNSFVFLAILLMVLAANWLALLLTKVRGLWFAYLGLLAFCFLSFYYPLSELLYLQNQVVRFIVASLITFSPILLANLIFSISFRDQDVAEHLFGWNLMGATLGGVLEYISMLTGYGLLTLIVTLCYSVVFLLFTLQRRKIQALDRLPA